MNIETIILVYGSVVVSAGLFYWLVYLHRRAIGPVSVSVFGAEPNINFNDRLLEQYISQQRRSFTLVWVAVVAGLLLGALLIARVVSSPTLDVKLAAIAIPLAGDIWLGRGCWRLYERSTSLVADALERAGSQLPKK